MAEEYRFPSRINANGYIMLPKQLRDKEGLETGDVVIVTIKVEKEKREVI